MGRMEGRVALVTGASRGIGRAIALALAGRGATVMAAAREDHARVVVDEIRALGGQADLVSVDVTDPSAVDQAVADLVTRAGRVDILVNNAGVTRDQLVLRMRRPDWDAV